MNIVLFGNNERADRCYDVLGGHSVTRVQGNQNQEYLKGLDSDLFILAGYTKILKQETIDIPRIMTINLHAGRLPEYRGSSVLNWALVNGENSFGLSIIKVDAGIDTGDVLKSREFYINPDDTIYDLQNTTNRNFPFMLAEVLKQIEDGTYELRKQNEAKAHYYRHRTPSDSYIDWAKDSKEHIHNVIRASMESYPAYSLWNGKKTEFLSRLGRQDDGAFMMFPESDDELKMEVAEALCNEI